MLRHVIQRAGEIHTPAADLAIEQVAKAGGGDQPDPSQQELPAQRGENQRVKQEDQHTDDELHLLGPAHRLRPVAPKLDHAVIGVAV